MKKDVQDTLALGVILILAPLIIFVVKTAMDLTMDAVASISSHIGLIGVLLCIYALTKQKA
ncbi:MAG: hypothetical protein QMC78_03485 [Methanocellales archaeon]|nr:hypothetical protein [Methanocellales archaeon]